MSKKLKNEEFIQKAIKVHGDKYDYSLVEYNGPTSNIIVTCLKHGSFEQNASYHLRVKNGCLKCRADLSANKLIVKKNRFIEKSKLLYGTKYNYDLLKYKSNKKLVTINCTIDNHGSFFQYPDNHLAGKEGCKICLKLQNKSNINLTNQEFIDKATLIHKNFYDYSQVNYINQKTKVLIVCKKHGVFEQKAHNHLNGKGCSNCKKSKGEELIKNFLDLKNIKYIQEKKFPNCKNILPLKFDFYLPDINTCIEFDGEQHFKPMRFKNTSKAINKLKSTQNNDSIKNNYCQQNNIILIRIRYDENIEEKLKTYNLECND